MVMKFKLINFFIVFFYICIIYNKISEYSYDTVTSKPADNTVPLVALGMMGGSVVLWAVVKFVYYLGGSDKVVSNPKPQ